MESSQKFMKSSQWLLIALTLIFTAFIAGLFIGRNYNRQPVQIQPLLVAPMVAAPILLLLLIILILPKPKKNRRPQL